MAHGSWNGIGHVWAVINGVPMDTTAFQGGYGWTSPKVSGYGSPDVMKAHHTGGSLPTNNDAPVINVTIEGDVYGIDDLDSKITEGVSKGLEKHFNNPYGVAL